MAAIAKLAGFVENHYYSHQIPADYLRGTRPDDPKIPLTERYYSPASPLRTANAVDSPHKIGITLQVYRPNEIKPPFGDFATPAHESKVSGSIAVTGWALTPQPNMIPLDGSTIDVYIDGAKVGNPVYNIYRKDIASLFPEYGNKNGAVGYFYINTLKYADGMHTIFWRVRDNAGNTEGIGSRFFTIRNNHSARTST
ncbi:MAG: hypothetical protein GY940_02405 [bacterium]|nr:hypothetical protein [bacterium]